MNSTQFSAAWAGVGQSWKNGRLAHAWLLQGAPHGAALRFAGQMLNLVFDDHPQVAARTHPDIIWLEPQSKSRRIGIDDILEMNRQLAQTSFAGGWKAGVLFEADRMTAEASNAFLKTLEEPAPRTLLLLLSGEPQALLPTILSRCQRIALTGEDEEADRAWKEPLLETLRALPPADILQAGLRAAVLDGLLDALKEQFQTEEDELLPEEITGKERKELLDARAGARLVEVRTAMLRLILQWQRDVMLLALGQNQAALYFQKDREALARQAGGCTRIAALRRVAAVEEMNRQFDRNLPAGLVFNSFFAQMV